MPPPMRSPCSSLLALLCALPLHAEVPSNLVAEGIPPIPSTLQGSSLLEGRNNMALFFTDYSLGFLGLFDGCWKYILEIDAQRSKLYDVCNDPGETMDLSARESIRVNAYRENLQSWIRSQALPR